MISINIPNKAYSTQEVSLGGFKYNFVFRFNEIDERWRLDLYKDNIAILLGLKLIETTSLIRRLHNPPEFSHGDLQCIRFKEDGALAGRYNTGVGLAYRLEYVTNEEIGL